MRRIAKVVVFADHCYFHILLLHILKREDINSYKKSFESGLRRSFCNGRSKL